MTVLQIGDPQSLDRTLEYVHCTFFKLVMYNVNSLNNNYICRLQDVSSPTTEVSFGKVKVPCNPGDKNMATPSKTQHIAVTSDYFIHTNGHSVKSYMMVVRVTCTPKNAVTNGMCNGSSSDIGRSLAHSTSNAFSQIQRDQ